MPVSYAGLGKDAALFIKDYYDNYKQAKKNAVDSSVGFIYGTNINQ